MCSWCVCIIINNSTGSVQLLFNLLSKLCCERIEITVAIVQSLCAESLFAKCLIFLNVNFVAIMVLLYPLDVVSCEISLSSLLLLYY